MTAGGGVAHLGVPEVRRTGGSVEYRVPFVLGAIDDTLWFRVPDRFADLVSPRADAALLALVVPALCVGGTLRVDGPVTDELVHGLHHGVLDLQALATRDARPLRVDAADPVPADPPAPGVLTAMSGGVDSFAVVADYLVADDVPPRLRVTHLVFNDVALHLDRAVVEDKRRRLAPLAEALGLPFLFVDSNLPKFLAAFGLSPLAANTPVNLAVPFLLQRGVGTFLLASAGSQLQLDVPHTDQIAYLDPLTLPALSTGGLRLVSAGSEYRRFDKYPRIMTVPGVERHLDVCIEPRHLGGNCSQCFKCLRTQAGLEILGLLDRFDAVFDRSIWERRRTRYYRAIQSMDSAFAREMVAEARARGVRLPRPIPLHVPLSRLKARLEARLG